MSQAAPGARVVIQSGNCLEFVACCFAIPGARQIMVPINTRLSEREIAEQIADTEPSIVFVEPAFAEQMRRVVDDFRRDRGQSIDLIAFGPASIGARAYDEWVETVGTAKEEELPEVREDDPAWILFTSGTTGRAKGAVLTHRNLMAGTCTTMASTDAGSREVALFQFPMFHISAYTLIWFLLKGYSIVIVRSFEASSCLRHIEEYRVSMMSIAPTMLALLLAHPGIDETDTSSLRLLTYGSASMPLELLQRAMERWPAIRFGTAFGMTELAGNVLYHDGEAHRRGLHDPDMLAACGRAMALSQVRLVDNDGCDVAQGEAGELAVKGDQVFVGYWRNDEANRTSFRDGWFLTGDVARRDPAGYHYIVDRKKDMIITGGENVYSREIELVLQDSGMVVEAAVIGVPDPIWGERVTAVVALTDPASEQSLAQLEDYCRLRMAGFKRPRWWIAVERLPRNASNKVLKGELRRGVAEGSLLVLANRRSDAIKARS